MTPEQAREYIAQFSKYTLKGTSQVTYENGDTIHFDNMTDDEALRVAAGLYSIEVEASEGVIKQ